MKTAFGPEVNFETAEKISERLQPSIIKSNPARGATFSMASTFYVDRQKAVELQKLGQVARSSGATSVWRRFIVMAVTLVKISDGLWEMPQPIGVFAGDLFERGSDYLSAFKELASVGNPRHESFLLKANSSWSRAARRPLLNVYDSMIATS